MDLIVVGETGVPPWGTPDSQLLIAAEAMGRCLISRDKRTMPKHLAAHFAAGRHTCGVLLLRGGFGVARYVHEIALIWQATTANEWIDRTDVIPY
jgi:hypothetical protein